MHKNLCNNTSRNTPHNFQYLRKKPNSCINFLKLKRCMTDNLTKSPPKSNQAGRKPSSTSTQNQTALSIQGHLTWLQQKSSHTLTNWHPSLLNRTSLFLKFKKT